METFTSLLQTYPLLTIYLLAVNTLAFALFFIDKMLAQSSGILRRVPEKTLLLTALFGGSIGAIIGVYLLRHKTKKESFLLTLALILLFHITIFGLLSYLGVRLDYSVPS